MINDVQKLLDDYTRWLRDKTQVRRIDDWIEITTPYLDRHNDYIQIYARKSATGYTLTDDGYTITDLELSGCKLESPKRQALLTMTLNGFGVRLSENRLEVDTTAESFALRKHNLMQAILAVNDLFYLAEPFVLSLFQEDVEAWLNLCDIRYTPKPKFTGKSGFDHLFDFVIPKSRRQPERILRAVNHPGRDTAEAIAFAWLDTKDVRAPDSRIYALLNDETRKIGGGVVEALKRYDVVPVPWSARELVREELAA
jgi:hypothetical protein